MAVFADGGVVACVSVMMKGLGWTFQQKRADKQTLAERHLPQVYLSHPTFPSLFLALHLLLKYTVQPFVIQHCTSTTKRKI